MAKQKTYKLETLIGHKRGKVILVNGTEYRVGQDCQIAGVAPADAAKLLQNKTWVEVGKKPAGAKTRKYSGISLLGVDGALIELEPTPEPTKEPDAPVTPPNAQNPPKPKEVPTEPVAEAIPALPPEVSAEPVADPPIPDLDAGEEWADPSESYSIEWLHDCADAYEIEYSKKLGKGKLVERIKAAMYEEGDEE